MRVVFLGTPDFAVPSLDALCRGGYDVVAVISQPDREKDKKGNVLPTPVRRYADENGLKCLQFDRVSAHVDELKELAPDVMITAAYGQLLSEQVLDVPKFGVLNVHASLLPKYRGSSPIQSAILCGETETGVTIMKTEAGMDTGDIVSTVKVEILDSDTTADLSAKLSEAGAKLLVNTLSDYAAGKITPVKQNDGEATYCKKITKTDGLIDWNLSAREIACKIRAYNPWPIAYSYLDGVALKIYTAQECDAVGAAGALSARDGSLTVTCKSGGLRLLTVQLPGKKAMPIAEFLRGHKIAEGSKLNNA